MPSIQELFALDGRVAIVTGGSRGLGEEMAETAIAESGPAEGAEKKQRFRSRALVDISAELCWLRGTPASMTRSP